MRALGTRGAIAALVAVLALVSGCSTRPTVEPTQVKAETPAQLREVLRERPDELDVFRSQGPFAVTTEADRELRLSTRERLRADLFLAAPETPAPLVIFVHGHEVSKEAHGNQALLTASWGLHSLAVQLPKTGPWTANGRLLARLVHLVRRSPDLLARRVDAQRIILVGHSFGASAITVAMAEGAPVIGAILLDPASDDRSLPKFLRRVDKPVLVLGADEEVASARYRDRFFEYLRDVRELSVRDATHEDAQYPSEFALRHFGFDPDVTESIQLTFVSAIIAGARSLAATGRFDEAWQRYAGAMKSGRLFDVKTK